jgi:hypothetical protein
MKMQQSANSATFEGDRASSLGALVLPALAAARRIERSQNPPQHWSL